MFRTRIARILPNTDLVLQRQDTAATEPKQPWILYRNRLIRFIAELAIIKKRTRIARIARMDKLCIREIRVIRVRCKNQLVLCFVGAVLALLVHCLLCWCSSCLVGAVLAWLVQLRQLHPLTECLVGALHAWLVHCLLGWCS